MTNLARKEDEARLERQMQSGSQDQSRRSNKFNSAARSAWHASSVQKETDASNDFSNSQGAIALAQKIRSLRRTRSRSERLCESVQQSLNHRASWRQDARTAPTQFPSGGPVIYANTCVNNGIQYKCFLFALMFVARRSCISHPKRCQKPDLIG